MSFLIVPLFTLISHYLLLNLGFCKAYQNCLVALNNITTVLYPNVVRVYSPRNIEFLRNSKLENKYWSVDFFVKLYSFLEGI